MKKPTYVKIGISIVMVILGLNTYAQNIVPFSPRYNEAIKGDILLIGNSNVGLDATTPYNGNQTNDNLDAAVYVDIDGDPNTFNSSSADLDVPSEDGCYRIEYAGLYWSAVVDGDEPISDVKFKLPGTTNYIDITGTEIYYQNAANNNNSNTYAYYHDVTDIVSALPDPEGTYTVANISSLIGPKPNSEGLSAGWSLFIVYENPILPSKYITSFDGFTKITSTVNETFPVSGFNTIPTGPVRAKFAFSTIEGDRQYTGDYLTLNGTTMNATNNAGTIIRAGDNFFNSSVSDINPATNTPELFTNRNPNSSNTLGFDAGIINIPNPGNTVIANGATSASISLGSTLDIYYYYFSAFAIDIIAPNIVLTKIVEDDAGNNIGDQIVGLGDPLNYIIGFQNTGNDDATNFQIRDILPINIVFNYPSDLVLPAGVTVASYNPTTRELIFDIADYLVEENDPALEIRIEAHVVDSCAQLADACSNIINNQAFATYQGTINPDFVITDDPSVSSNTGCLLTPQATNFLADLNDCTFEENVTLCGSTVDLTAANGYDAYSWSTSPSGSPVIGTTQTITVDATGTYYVHNTAAAPCQSIDQTFNVQLFGNNITNPVIPYADEVVICPNDGKELPNIFLCGANDSRFIQTNISDSTSIIWEKLDETSCAAVTDPDCANEDNSCTWNEVANGPDYVVDTYGQYRLTINYPGGCFVQFYFNVYENILNPTVISSDIICDTLGSITVNGVPSGYEYSIDNSTFQASNTFSISTAGLYTVYIRQIGIATNPCVFTVPDVQIRDRDFNGSVTTSQPLCHGDLGDIQLAANDAEPQYFFSLFSGGTLVNSVGPIEENNYAFNNLNPGTYTVTIETEDGCSFTADVTIEEPPLLTVTAAITVPLTCTDGEITVYPEGGTPPYYYFVNSTTEFQSAPQIVVIAPGVFDIMVVDANNCTANTSITVDAIAAPEYNITTNDILCGGSGNTGSLTINVTNPNGNSIEYSIDGGSTFSNSSIFTGLTQGDYDVVVQHTAGSSLCYTDAQTVTINENTAISGTAELSAPYTCASTGTITVTGVSGGTSPYSYSIDGVNFQAGNTFSGLTQGTYTVTVMDANDCTLITNSITIDALDPPTDLSFSNTPVTCPSNTTDVTITSTTGGTGVLQYQIISPAGFVTPYQTSTVFTGLTTGTYTFQVIDENDCTYSETYSIAPLVEPTVNVVLNEGLDCTSTPDAEISGSITGSAPYTYAVSINGGTYTSLGSTGSSFVYTTSTAATYQFEITDANGCTAESSVITINPISPPVITSVSQSQDILCNGDANGSIDVVIDTASGTPPFVININNDTTGVNYGNQTSGLPAGTYTVTVTDANSCTDTDVVIISEPDAITVNYHTVDISCGSGGVSQGSIIIDSVSGGIAPYNYFVTGTNSYSNSELNASGSTSVSFDVVDFGLYEINVIDSNGCSVLIQDVLVASPPTDLDIDIDTSVNCLTGGTAVVSIGSSLTSSGPFYFSIYQGSTSVYPNPPGSWFPEDTPGSQSATFTGLTPDVLYTFIVYDASTNCSYYEPATTAIPTNSTLTTTAVSESNVSCTGSADGNVSFTVNSVYGVATTISYEIFDSLTLASTGISGTGIVPANGSLVVNDFGPLPFGNYYVYVQETSGPNTGCGIATPPFNITESEFPLELMVSVDQNANCNPNSGLISATGQNGTAPYLYQVTTTSASPLASDSFWTSTSTFNLDAGNYYVHVIDTYECIVTSPLVVLPNDPTPVISAAVTNQCTVTEGNYEINVTLDTAGVAPYSYSIDGGAFQTMSAPFTISNLFSGTHTVEINDANGCGNLVSVIIDTPLLITPTVTSRPSCNNDDGEITMNTSGGTGNYTYSITPSPASISLLGNIYSGVPSGSYTITVTDTSNSCTETVEIAVPNAVTPTLTSTPSVISCFGDNSGEFELEVNEYTGTYTYEVFDDLGNSVTGSVSTNTSSDPQIVGGLAAGTYSVMVNETSNPFCTASSNVIILSPAEALTLTATETSNVTCTNSQGTIVATANGGWGNYEYELSGTATIAYSSNSTFTNLSAGNYTINVRDAQGCIETVNVLLEEPTPIDATFTPSTNMLSCYGDQNANIIITNVTGGQGSNYLYTLNTMSPTTNTSGPQASNTFNGLGAGTYNITITDGYECSTTSIDIVIDEPSPIESILVVNTTQTCTTDATLTLSASGGTGSYEYSDTNSFASILGAFATSTTFSAAPGTYQYYVRDANNCFTNASNEITVDNIPPLSLDLDLINATINCAGDNTGVIVADAEGGLGNYVYTLRDGLGNTIAAVQDTPGVFTELVAGDYEVYVESGDCNFTSQPISITEPSAPLEATLLVENVSCSGTETGSVAINATGGTGIIKYAISPQLNQFFESNIFENLAPADYDVIVQDELGCYQVLSFTITEPEPVIINIVANSIFSETCEGDADGEFSIDISGGTMPYSVSLDDYNGVYTTGNATQTEFVFNGLEGGDHMVYVRDNEGCESEWNITFPESVRINPEVSVEYDCDNNNQVNTVTVTVDDSITDPSELDYALNGGPYQASNVFTNLVPGVDNYIDVRHIDGCIQTTDYFDIYTYDPVAVILAEGELNEIIANANGGTGDYQYLLNDEDYGDTNNFIITESGEYTVTVIDRNGCYAIAAITLEFIDICIPNYFSPNGDGVTDTWAPGCITNFPNLTFDIFDRYGRKVATYRAGEYWDGKYNGNELPTGDYWYVVQTNDSNMDREFVGHFTLYR